VGTIENSLVILQPKILHWWPKIAKGCSAVLGARIESFKKKQIFWQKLIGKSNLKI